MAPYRTFLVLGLAVGTLGAGYVFASQQSPATVATAPMPKAAPVATAATPAAPTAKPASTLVANRAPVPLVTRTHNTYLAPKAAEASAPAQPSVPSAAAATTDISTAALTVGAGADGGLPPPPGEARPGDSTRAKAAVELDGYKNVRGLEKGPDGVWRGRAMRGRTEIAIRVDSSGSVSAE